MKFKQGEDGLGTFYHFLTKGGNVDLSRGVGVASGERDLVARIWQSHNISDLTSVEAILISEAFKEASILATAWEDGRSHEPFMGSVSLGDENAYKAEVKAEYDARRKAQDAKYAEQEAKKAAEREAEKKRRADLIAFANRLIEAAGGKDPHTGPYYADGPIYKLPGNQGSAYACFVKKPGDKWNYSAVEDCRIGVSGRAERDVRLSFATFAKYYGGSQVLKTAGVR